MTNRFFKVNDISLPYVILEDNFMNKISQAKLSIPFKWIAIVAYTILIIPILIFFGGWLKWYLAVLFSGILLFGAYWVIKKDYWNNKDCIEIPIRIFLAAGIAFSLWVLISGSCYTSVGKCDIIWRTTTLRDLVNYDWPVYYPEKNGYLCYYFTFWIVPALVGKLFGGMPAAYIALACWFVLILLTAFLLIVYYFKDSKRATLKVILLFMIMWSGINILGQYCMNHIGLYPYPAGFGDNEGYCDNLWNVNGQPFCFLYRSNEDFLSQCYNQLPIWIAVPLMLQNRNIRNYAFLGLILFPYSPWGTLGIALIMIVDAIYFLIKRKSVIKFMKEVFSIPNLCAVFSVFLVFVMFVSCENIGDGSQKFGILGLKELTPQILQGTLIFWASEFGIFYFLTWKKYKMDHLYVSVGMMLLIMPFIWVSSRYSRDFCMDATLPQLYVLMIYMIGYVKDEIFNKELTYHEKFKSRNCVLIIVLGLAFTTPVFDWINKISTMNSKNSISIQDRSISTFADTLGYEGEFGVPISTNVGESIFFKYLAKPIDKENYKWLPISENLSEIRNIYDINKYFDYLIGKDCTIFIAVQDIQGYSLTQEIVDKMKQLGFDENIDFLLQKEYHSFIGIVNNGQIITNQVGGDEYITYYGKGQINGDNVWMGSGTLNHGNCSAINIKNSYYSAHGRGFNIVVKDNAADRVIDSVVFDTHTEEMKCTRKPQ